MDPEDVTVLTGSNGGHFCFRELDLADALLLGCTLQGKLFDFGAEVLVLDDLETPVNVLDNGRHRFHPVAGVEVMNFADHLVFRGMDMAADDTGAATLGRELLQVIFKAADVADGGLDACLDGLGKGKVFLAPEGSPFVVKAIEAQKLLVADIPDDSDKLGMSRNGIKAIAMHDEVFALVAHVDVLFDDAQFVESQGQVVREKVVMIATEVDHIHAFLRELQDAANDFGMAIGPDIFAFQAPAVYHVPVEDELITAAVLEEKVDFLRLTVVGAQMQVGQDYCPESYCRFLSHSVIVRLVRRSKLWNFKVRPWRALSNDTIVDNL